ncbi:putative pectinesterase/pectinesterase inhibitor 41 [Apostasia shenzhenica]|uniref:Pectinesterase n=1 Tax=Apostasia shenzhenica TaxID=1088818 RepID=A0A2I0AVP8_9ASPA|nr:putative pectinesterase/pectinesterase inhibitor 41 [Apostasia shenzhenica]
MAPFSRFPILLVLLLLLLTAAAAATAAAAISDECPANPCSDSCNSSLCASIVSMLQASAVAIEEYGLHAVEQSIEVARKTAAFLGGAGDGPAMGICREMAAVGADELELARNMLEAGTGADGGVSPVVTAAGAATLRMLLTSAAVSATTCLEGLEEKGVAGGEVFRRVEEARELFGIALDLVHVSLERVAAERIAVDTFDEWTFHPTASMTIQSSLESLQVTQTVTVAKDGGGNFTTVKDAVAFASQNPPPPSGYFKILVSPGVYEENVVIPKYLNGLILQGAGIERTVITSGRSSADGYETFDTATLAVNGCRFIASGITIKNTAGREKMQAVAVRNSADLSVFHQCLFVGFQDTLYAHSKRQLYVGCSIFGTVDFIFGSAAAVFQNCSIMPRLPLPGQKNTITAQGKRCPREQSGFSVHLSRVFPARDLADGSATARVSTYLGRPWKSCSTTVFMQSNLGGFIDPAGWIEWDGRNPPPPTIYYGEYDNVGPGASTAERVGWEVHKKMTEEEAERFTVAALIDEGSWPGNTGVPFESGLI